MRNSRVVCSFPAKYFIANAMTAGNASQKLVNGILAGAFPQKPLPLVVTVL
jgi:hypothetical protein